MSMPTNRIGIGLEGLIPLMRERETLSTVRPSLQVAKDSFLTNESSGPERQAALRTAIAVFNHHNDKRGQTVIALSRLAVYKARR
ncbi:hypothetical protein EV130_105479 [Rhizobium azibense]|uniref:Uncharacterized protein n=1 Tax=Rhizobium azibense TaxID=1136135 RepID=A0A4R3QUV1_9HYPH|nr:hypothetical protein EV130_105479 [Rhizobium azibense]